MKYPIRRRAQAQASIERIFDHIAAENPAAALRFVDVLEARLELLSENPEAGPRYDSPHPTLRGLRKWVISRFSTLLFYYVENNAIHVVDVIDGRTDYDVEDNP